MARTGNRKTGIERLEDDCRRQAWVKAHPRVDELPDLRTPLGPYTWLALENVAVEMIAAGLWGKFAGITAVRHSIRRIVSKIRPAQKKVDCPRCGGAGARNGYEYVPPDYKKTQQVVFSCGACKGTGKVKL